MDTEEIIAAIEGEPLLEETPVPDTSEKIAGSNTEAVSLSEGSIYYDVRFYIVLDEEGRMKILFDMEAQKDYYPGYKIVTRGIVYCARMISAQIGQEFDLEHYDDLKKVYSIWICFNPPAYIGNAISRYTMGKEDLLPGIPDEKRAYDKLEIVQICLREDLDQKDDELIRMLNILFSSRKSKEEIKRELEEDYGITMDDGYGKEIDTMCNLSYMFEERGMKRGMERGMKTGMERGMKTGMKTGMERGITEVAGNLILMGKDNAFRQPDPHGKRQCIYQESDGAFGGSHRETAGTGTDRAETVRWIRLQCKNKAGHLRQSYKIMYGCHFFVVQYRINVLYHFHGDSHLRADGVEKASGYVRPGRRPMPAAGKEDYETGERGGRAPAV